MTQSQTPIIGRVLHGTIEIIRLIGEGGMGHVYEGYQAHLNRKLAVKVLLPEHAKNPVAAEYFLREAKSSSQLRHPNIIEIIDFGKEQDDLLFLAMEFIPGKPLSALIEEVSKGEALDPARIISILTQTLSGLEEAHACNIVHRDLKPDNLMIERTRSDQDFVKILDFGIAHLQGGEIAPGSLTQQGALLGTPHYMSPEQACGEAVDARSDLFSMGTILYEVLTGCLPFEGNKLPKLLMSVISHTPVSPSARAPELGINPQLEVICMRALNKEKELRYQSARAFREALQEVSLHSTPATPAPAVSPRFIFKRAKKAPEAPAAEVSSLVETLFEETSEAASGAVPPSFEQGKQGEERQKALSGELVNVGLLLASAVSEVPEGIQKSAPLMSAPEASKGLSMLQQGLSSLRGDLVVNRTSVYVLAIHQRSTGALDPEAFIEQHERMEQILVEVCSQWDGVLHSRQGGFTILLFGLPTPQTNDGVRAGQAALSLIQMLGSMQRSSMVYGLSLTHGDVVVPPSRSLTHIAGPPIDEAVEVSRLAKVGDVLVGSGSLQDQLGASFELEEQDSNGHRILKSLNTQDRASLIDEDDRALVGREKQVAQLLALLGRMLRGEGGVLLIHGPTGVGKSALVRQSVVLAHEREILTIKARQRFGGAQGLYDVFKQWLRQDALARQAEVHTLARVYKRDLGLKGQYGMLLQALLEDRLAQTFAHQGSVRSIEQEDSALVRVQAAMMAYMSALGGHQRVLFVLDGIDPYDPFIEMFVQHMTHVLAKHTIGLVLGVRTYKEDNTPRFPEGASLMRVDPLPLETCLRYLKVALPQLTLAQHQRIARLSAGNLMQLHEIIGAIDASPEEPQLALEQLGDSLVRVHELLILHLKRLPRHVQNILGLLAVLQDGADQSAIGALASASWEYEEALNYAYEHDLIHVQEGIGHVRVFFDNPLLAQSIYKILGARVRKETHTRAAAYFQGRLDDESNTDHTDDMRALIHHLTHCGELSQALSLAQELIDALTLAFSYEEAQALIDATLRQMTTHEMADASSRVGLLLKKARVLELQGQTPEALEVIKSVHRTQDIPLRQSQEVELTLSALWLEQEDPSLIEGMLKRLIESTAEGLLQDDAKESLWLHLRAQQQLAKTYEKLGRIAHARATLMKVLELIESHHVDPTGNPWGPSLVWGPLNQLGRLQLKEGHPEDAYKSFKFAMQIVQEAQDPFGEATIAANLGSLYVMTSEYKKAHQALKHAVDLARRSGQMKMIAKLKYNQGMLYLKINSTSLAQESFQESASLSDAISWREGIAQAHHQLKRLEAFS